MTSKVDGLVGTVAWVIGGVVVSVAALFAIFGGFILGLLMLAATPFVIGFLALDAIFGKRPVYLTSVQEKKGKCPPETSASDREPVDTQRITEEGCAAVSHRLPGARDTRRSGSVGERGRGFFASDVSEGSLDSIRAEVGGDLGLDYGAWR